MKLKYYLRGVGTGILFATIILFISYSYKMSDGQIKKRAEELGMVMSTEEQNSSNLINNSTDKAEKPTGEEESTSKQPTNEEPSTKEPASEEPSSEEPSSEEPTTKEPSTKEPASEETTTKEPTSEQTTTNSNQSVTCTLTVTNRTGSDDVAYMLAQAGIIEDAEEFNEYLISNGYAYRIQNGTFTFKKGMTYKEMADYLTSGRY